MPSALYGHLAQSSKDKYDRLGAEMDKLIVSANAELSMFSKKLSGQ